MTSSRIDFPLKRVSEVLKYNSAFTGLISFQGDMTSGDLLSTCIAIVSVFSGTDPTPSALVSAITLNVITQQVSLTITGGVAGTTYSITLQATTNLGQVLERSGYLTVINDN